MIIPKVGHRPHYSAKITFFDSPAHLGEALTDQKRKRNSALKSVRWNHLPHDALSLEIASRVSRRDASDAEREVRLHYLRDRLHRFKLAIHDEYINHISTELKRELRICRDVYCDFLKRLNNRSITAKARVALDYAVAPMASRRLREEVLVYVNGVGVSDFMFAALFCRVFDHLVRHPNFDPTWIEISKVLQFLIPDTCFQELKEATSRQVSCVAQGPFGDPAEPFQVVFINGREVGLKPNAIWDFRNMLFGYELWRLWDFVFREICDQHAAIDYEERSNLAFALIALNPFERLAGRMFHEASERYISRVPNKFFIEMGRQLDTQQIGLFENLDARGKKILQYLGRQGKPINSWEAALADRREYKFLPAKAESRTEATTLKEFGTLSRCAKRAFYRAKESYSDALQSVYEKRVPASMRTNPFQLNR